MQPLRKPAVKSTLKRAERKRKEGKLDEAKIIAKRAGKNAEKSGRENVISGLSGSGKIGVDITVSADGAVTESASGNRPLIVGGALSI